MGELTITESAIVEREAGGLGQNPAAVYLASLESERSRRTMLTALGSIADLLFPDFWPKPERPTLPDDPTPEQRKEHRAALEGYRAEYDQYKRRALAVPWHELRFSHVQAMRTALLETISPRTGKPLSHETVNKRLSALRGVLGAAFDLGRMDAQDYQRAVKVESVKGETLPAGRSITAGEFAAMMDACMADQTPSGPRDAAILGILYSGGLRRAELVRLDLADYDQEQGALKVRGKRNKERLVYPASGALDALGDWLALRGPDAGALFWAVRRGGHIQQGQRLTTQAIYHILGERADQAGVKELSPHDFRRTFVGDLLDAGADIATVQKMAGHASVTTTARYDRRPEQAKRKAASLLHVPYHRRTLGEGADNGDGASC